MRRRLLVASLLPVLVAACGGNSDPAAGPTASQPATEPTPETTTAESEPTTEDTTTEAEPPPPEAPPGVPSYVAGYRGWVKLNDAPIPPREADPHLGTKNVYASKEKRRDLYPAGTVIVKEARRPGADFVGLVAGMRKVAGSNPEHNDWIFVEWTRESRDAPFTELARGAVCESCHSGVAPQDYVFTTG